MGIIKNKLDKMIRELGTLQTEAVNLYDRLDTCYRLGKGTSQEAQDLLTGIVSRRETIQKLKLNIWLYNPVKFGGTKK